MKMKLIIITLLTTSMFGWAACPKPTDALVCSGNQDPMCNNECTKITGDGTKHKDCLGDGSSVNCQAGTGSAGITIYTYAMLDIQGAQTFQKVACNLCGSTLLTGPNASSVNCRTASDGADPCPVHK